MSSGVWPRVARIEVLRFTLFARHGWRRHRILCRRPGTSDSDARRVGRHDRGSGAYIEKRCMRQP